MLNKTSMVRWMIVGGIVAAAIGLMSPAVSSAQTTVRVDCEAGESVQAALNAAATVPGRITILVHGVCKEAIEITRDDVTIRGGIPEDGFTLVDESGESGRVSIYINSARKVVIENMTIMLPIEETQFHMMGVFAIDASNLELRDLSIIGGSDGIRTTHSSASLLKVQTRDQKWYGVIITGGRAYLSEVEVRHSRSTGLLVSMMDYISVRSSGFSENKGAGIGIEGSHALIRSTGIKGNSAGIGISNGSFVKLLHVDILDNESTGVLVQAQSYLHLDGAQIENNLGHGIYAQLDSLVVAEAISTDAFNYIRNNALSGIYLGDTSILRANTRLSVASNGEWGVYCETAPATAYVTRPGMQAWSIAGNGLGATNCPPLGISGRLP
jgi:hypothetical protein